MEGGVGDQVIRQALCGIVASELLVDAEEALSHFLVEFPFDNGAGEVPSDVGRTREKVIVAVRGGVELPDISVLQSEPLVGHHAPVRDDRTSELEMKRAVEFLAGDLREIEAGHVL